MCKHSCHPPYIFCQVSVKRNMTFTIPKIVFFLVKNREKYNFGYSERHIPFYRNLTENIWGMTAMFTHRFTEILKDLE